LTATRQGARPCPIEGIDVIFPTINLTEPAVSTPDAQRLRRIDETSA
jgi:hypothetical protein